jgi:hypothetical protein
MKTIKELREAFKAKPKVKDGDSPPFTGNHAQRLAKWKKYYKAHPEVKAAKIAARRADRARTRKLIDAEDAKEEFVSEGHSAPSKFRRFRLGYKRQRDNKMVRAASFKAETTALRKAKRVAKEMPSAMYSYVYVIDSQKEKGKQRIGEFPVTGKGRAWDDS